MSSITVVRGTREEDLYGIYSFEMRGYEFYVVTSSLRGDLEGPYLSLDKAIQVLAEILVMEGQPILKAVDSRGSDWETDLVEIDRDQTRKAICEAASIDAEELQHRQARRDSIKFLQLDERVQDALIDLLTPVKDSTSPVQRFQPSRRSYDSSSDSWISCFSLNEFHCFSDSVG